MEKKNLVTGKKLRMTQVFGSDGLVSPGTAVLIDDSSAFSWLTECPVVHVSGETKGRGFAGVVKRWGFAGGPMTHGSGWSRKPGSIGGTASPGRVYRGKKMPGRMGGKKITKKAVRLLSVDVESKTVLLKGSLPGSFMSKIIMWQV